MDDAGQLYIPLELAQDAGDAGAEEEKDKNIKKLKRTFASVAADGATLCSARIGAQKGRKNLRECCQYLKDNRIDRTQFWRKVGDVLVCDLEALE